MPAGTRRYVIELVVQTQQVEQAAAKVDAAQEKIEGALRRQAALTQSEFDKIGRMAAQIGVTAIAWQTATAASTAYYDAQEKAHQRQQQWAHEANQQQVSEVELAGMMNMKPGAAFQKENAQFALRTGLGHARTMRLREAFYSAGAQYIGQGGATTMGHEQAKKYEEGVAAIAVDTGIDPQDLGDLAGTLLGKTDWRKQFGLKDAEMATTQMAQVASIIQKTRGKNPVIARQISRSLAELVKKERELGNVGDPVELAAMIAAQAERNPAAAGVYLSRAVSHGMHQWEDKKAASLFKKAGIERTDDVATFDRKMDTYFRKAKKPGDTMETFLMQAGFSDREAKGLDMEIQARMSGATQTYIDDAKKITPKHLIDAAKERQQDPVFKIQQAQAAEELSKTVRGQDTGPLAVARQNMAAQMRANKQIETPETSTAIGMFNSGINPLSWFGFKASEEALVDAKLSGLLQRATGVHGIDQWTAFDATRRQEILQEQIAALEAKGMKVEDVIPLAKEMRDALKVLAGAVPQNPPVPAVPNFNQQGGMVKP